MYTAILGSFLRKENKGKVKDEINKKKYQNFTYFV